MLNRVHSKSAIVVLSFIFAIIFQQYTYSAEKFGRKSISIISEPLLTPSASDIPPGRSQEILSAIRLQIQMPRFDYNYMPTSQEIEFWKRGEIYFNETMKNLESVTITRADIERQLIGIDANLTTIREQIKDQEELIKSLTESGRDASKQKIQLAKNKEERDKYERQRSSLIRQRDDLIKQQGALEVTLFRQSSELMSETIAPKISSILADPELQKIRAKQYVSEAERNSFIVLKAKELGITSEDIERVMNSAYICLVVLTDYSYYYSKDEKTGERILTYNLEGGVIWSKLVMSQDDQKATIQPLKEIRIQGSASGYPDRQDPFSKVDPDTQIFRNAVNSFVSRLEIETRKIDDFSLKTQIVESVGSRVGFPLGNNDGLYVGQKFRVYENVKYGEQIKVEKRGFFYVTKVGDNKTNPSNLSYGKAVIGSLEPGMEVREYATSGVGMNISGKYGIIGIKSGSIKTKYDLNVKEDTTNPLVMLNLSVDYDLGRTTSIPQLYASIGGDIGFTSFDNISIDFGEGSPTNLYFDLYGGVIKKVYLKNIALCIEPLFQYQALDISNSDKNGNSVSFNNSALSFSPCFSLEIALRENFNIGFSFIYNKALGATNQWTGTYTPKNGEPEKLFDGFIDGPEVSYPNVIYGGYINISF